MRSEWRREDRGVIGWSLHGAMTQGQVMSSSITVGSRSISCHRRCRAIAGDTPATQLNVFDTDYMHLCLVMVCGYV